MTANLIGPSSHREVAGIGENVAAAWEVRGSSEAEHGQRLLRVSFPFYLAHVGSLSEVKLAKALVLSLPA